MKKFRKNLTLLVSVLTILAMALVGCSSNSGGSGGGGSPNGGSGSGSSPNGGSSTVAVTGVKFWTNWKGIRKGETTTLTAIVSPSNATNQNVTWKSKDKSVATVDNNGKVTGVDVGTTTITVTTVDGSHAATAWITVKVPVSVSLDKTSETIYVGDDTHLEATVSPSDANQAVTWKSSNPAVARIKGFGRYARVTGVSAGVAKITATTTDGNHTATATVTVSQEWNVLDSTINVTPTPLPAGGITFPTGTNDSGSATIKHKFALAKTEVTYELWKKVYDWANKGNNTCQSNGQYCYTFANEGWKGGTPYAPNTGGTVKQPVTTVSWRDAIVWSNAYTEWYNAEKGGSLTVVYKRSGTPLRDATKTADVDGLGSTFDNTSNTATGFRLPTSQEWEFAARLRTDSTNTVANGKPSGVNYPLYIGGTSYWFTKGNSASGATADYNDATETGKFAWYEGNSCDDGTGCSSNRTGTKQSKTRDVATKAANALGIYDMSGNVWEWCFDISSGSNRVFRGGGWSGNVGRLRVGRVGGNSPDLASSALGFRLARTVP